MFQLFVTVVLILMIGQSIIDDLLHCLCGPQVLIEAKEQQQFEASWGHSMSKVCHDNISSAEQTLHNVCCTIYVLGQTVLGVKLPS